MTRLHELQNAEGEQIAPSAYVAALGMTDVRLAELTGISLAVIRDYPSDPALQRFLAESVEIICTLVDLNGGSEARAIQWYRSTPLTELGAHLTAEEHVARGRANSILRYVQNLSVGSTG